MTDAGVRPVACVFHAILPSIFNYRRAGRARVMDITLCEK